MQVVANAKAAVGKFKRHERHFQQMQCAFDL